MQPIPLEHKPQSEKDNGDEWQKEVGQSPPALSY